MYEYEHGGYAVSLRPSPDKDGNNWDVINKKYSTVESSLRNFPDAIHVCRLLDTALSSLLEDTAEVLPHPATIN